MYRQEVRAGGAGRKVVRMAKVRIHHFREMKQRREYEKPSERRAREKGEAVRRAKKAARKQAQREGLLPAPKRKLPVGKGRPGAGAGAPRPPSI